jgi:PAS domain S-box-containing protein
MADDVGARTLSGGLSDGVTVMTDADKSRDDLLAELGALRAEVERLRRASLLSMQSGEAPSYALVAALHAAFLTEASADPIFLFDSDGRFLAANPAAADAMNLTPEAMIGRTMHELFPPAIADRQLAAVRRVLETGQALHSEENESRTRSGPRWFNTSLVPVKDDAGAVRYVLGVARDVTERKRAEEALRAHETELQTLYDRMGDGVLAADIETRRFVRANPAVCRMLGYTRAELLDLTVDDIHPPQDRERVRQLFADQAAGRVPVAQDVPCRRKDGTVLHVDIGATRVTLDGRACSVGLFRDATERRRTEEALRHGEARYRAVVESQTEYVVRFRPGGLLTFVNGAVCRLAGRTSEELIGTSFLRYLPPQEGTDLIRRLGALTPASPVLADEQAVVDAAGRRRRIQWVNRALFDEAGRIVEYQAVGRDVTEQRETEEALRRSEEQYRALFDQSVDGVLVVQDSRIVSANLAFAAILGKTVDEIVGLSPLNMVAPEERHIVRKREPGLLAASPDTPSDQRYHMPRADGTVALVEARSRRIDWKGRPAVQSIFRDVTQRVRMEEELQQAMRMEAVGQLAGGIAHDFNNLMTGILCHAGLLKDEAESPDEVRETAAIIESAARRAAELTSQLLGFARQGKHQDVPVDLNRAVQTSLRLLGRTLDARIRVHTHFAPGAMAQGDPAQMEQVVLNLAVNARDAMPDGGDLTVVTERVEVGGGAVDGDRSGPRRYVVLTVRDTGVGIPAEHRGRIFEPFFTTKPRGRGTGMGLAMVYGIVRNHGGTVEVESEEGRGTTIRVLLPEAEAVPESAEAEVAAAPAAAASSPASPAEASAPPVAAEDGRGASVLVVDDEEMVRNVVVRMLSARGYRVTAVCNGREAVDAYRARPGGFDLVIIDMLMPEMDGRACFHALRQADPGVRAILCTGWGSEETIQDLLEAGMRGLVRKPYEGDQLARAIREALA